MQIGPSWGAPARRPDDRGAAGHVADGGLDRVTFVLGGARSGTSWLAKILDSHPDVLYRHEPDIALQGRREPDFPRFCELEEEARYLPAARAYYGSLLDIRALRTSGSLPVFRKSYQAAPARHARLALALALRAAERFPGAARAARGAVIPDFVAWRRHPHVRLVVKSVSSLARAGLLAAAMPQARFVLVLRHPCGQVASRLRGIALGKLRGNLGIGECLRAGTARHHGLTPERFASLSGPEQHAWDWAILNQWALERLRGAASLKVVRYEDVCADPVRGARDLLSFAGLSWNAQTARFIADSTTHNGPDRYYKVLKNTQEAAARWRRELDAATQASILDVVRRTEVGRMFADGGGCRPAVVQPHVPEPQLRHSPATYAS